LRRYPARMWRFELLERLPAGCSEQRLRGAEQRAIDRFRSWRPQYGFNMNPAVWTVASAARDAACQRITKRLEAM
jgi:hypothetical protein